MGSAVVLFMDVIQGFGGLFAWSETAAAAGEHAAAHEGMSLIGLLIYVALVIAFIFWYFSQAKKGFAPRVFTNKKAHVLEHLYLYVENMATSIIGPHGKKYVPILLVIWTVIFVSNVVSLFFASAPTADLSFNVALALVAIAYVQYEGIKQNGLFGHLSHFAGPKMGLPLIAINIMLFLIEIVSELMKNLSLSLRLYGNIEGGHKAVTAMNDAFHHIGGSQLTLPLGFFLMPVKMLTCVVQALVFSLLFSVYLSLVTHHDHDDDHSHDDHGHEALAAHA